MNTIYGCNLNFKYKMNILHSEIFADINKLVLRFDYE